MKRKLIQKAKDFKEWMDERNKTRCESCGEEIVIDPGTQVDEYFRRFEPKGHGRFSTKVDMDKYYCAECVGAESL